MRKSESSQRGPVRYGIFDSPLGSVIVAATSTGVCAIAFADDAETLRTAWLSEQSGSNACESNAAVASFADALLTSLSGGTPLRLPLDVQGTPFQQRVWAALQAIPRGSTQTYTQVAQSLGLPPTSARAVAQACAANPVAVAIPCHRVLGATGDLRGYRWGMERKRHLLLLERTPAQRTLLMPEAAMLGLT